jgi:hypothetical protein
MVRIAVVFDRLMVMVRKPKTKRPVFLATGIFGYPGSAHPIFSNLTSREESFNCIV